MHLRQSINAPTRFDEEDLDEGSAKPTSPAFRKMLQSTIVAFNPHARQAAFPSLDLRQPDLSQIPSCSSGSYYSDGILTLKIPGLRYFYDSSLRHRRQQVSFAQHEKLTAQGTDTINFANARHTMDGQVTWDMIDLPMQVYLYSDLIIQLSSPEAVARRLGLDMKDVVTVHRAYQIRKLYPATSQQLWDYCVSMNTLTGANYIEPERLTQFLDYFALSGQYEFVSKEQISRAITFLRHHHIDTSILERLLQRPKGMANSRTLSASYTPLHRTPKRHQSARTSLPHSHEARNNPSMRYLSVRHLGKIYNRIVVLNQRRPSLSMKTLEKNVIGSRGQDQGTFALYFSSDYFPADGRMVLSGQPLSSLTSLEHWLMYGVCCETVFQGALEPRHTVYASMRALTMLHNRCLQSFDKLRPTSKTKLVYVEILGCIWLCLIKRGWLVSKMIRNRISKIPLTKIQRRAYRIVAGNFERLALCRSYEQTKSAFLHSLQKRKDVNQYKAKVKDFAMPSTKQHSHDHYRHTRSAHQGAISFRTTQAANPPEIPLPVSRSADLSQGLDNSATGNITTAEFQRSYASMAARDRSETLSTNGTLDMSGQTVRYCRAEPNIGYANVVPANRELRFEGDISLDELFHAFVNDDPQQTSPKINKIEDTQSSQAPSSPVAPPFSPISVDGPLPQVGNSVESDDKTQNQTSSPLLHGPDLLLQGQTPWKGSNRDSSDIEVADDSYNGLNTKQDVNAKSGLLHRSSRTVPIRLKIVTTTENLPSREPSSPHARHQNTMERLSTTAPPEVNAPREKTSRTGDVESEIKKRSGTDDQNSGLERYSPAICSGTTETAPALDRKDRDDEDERPRKRVKVAPGHSTAQVGQPEKSRSDKGKKRGPYMTKKRRERMQLASMGQQAQSRD